MLARLFLLLVIPAAAVAAEPAPAILKPGAREPISPPAFRLPDTAAPERYDWHVAIDPRSATFDATVVIDLRFKRSTPVLWLNATALEIGAVSAEQGERTVDVAIVPGGDDFVGLRGDFVPGPARVRIAYRGKVDGAAVDGIFRQQERGDWYVLTQFQPIGARRAVPCFDEPGWKAPWRITIDAPGSELAVANTPAATASRIAGRAGWWRHEFTETRPLPSYLVALAVGPFDVVQGGVAGRNRTPLRYLTPRGRAHEARFAARVTPSLLEALEDYFGLPFPFEKLDSIAIPHLVTFAAMENVGLVTYGAQWLLAREHEETSRFREGYVGLAAHEIAHMWFGNLVTLAWWDDTWLNEAFASWVATKVAFALEPAWDDGVYRSGIRHSALRADRLSTARAIANPVETRNAIDDAFDDITYSKGEEVLAMFEAYLGPERFRAGVRAFLRRHAWGSARSADFFEALGESSALAAFVRQPGAPLIDAALRCDASTTGKGPGAHLAVQQRRFRPVGSRAPELEWSTPACFRSDQGSFCSLVDGRTRRIEIPGARCPEWIVGNANGTGHYLVRYEEGLLRRLRANAGKLPQHEAQAWVKDTLLLAESGLLPIPAALEVADAALGHPSPNVQLAGVRLLEGLRDAWLGSRERQAKERIVAARVAPLARDLGWDAREGEGDDLRELRPEVLRFAADREAGHGLRAEARRRALLWLADRQSVDAMLAPTVLAVAGRFADAATFERFAQAARAADNPRERNMLLAALARVRDPGLRDRALALPLDARSTFSLLHRMLQDDENRATAFDHVRRHFAVLEAKLPRDTLSSLLEPMGRLCTPGERAAFAESFRDRAAQWMSGPLRYAQALEGIDLCIAAHGHRGLRHPGRRNERSPRHPGRRKGTPRHPGRRNRGDDPGSPLTSSPS